MQPKITLRRTCDAYPEQYDVFADDVKIGYLRLRHGWFRADYPECGGETVYSAEPNGDGIFDDDERDYYLRFAIDALLRRHAQGPQANEPLPAPDVSYEVIQ